MFEMIRNSLNIIVDFYRFNFFRNQKAGCGCKIFPGIVTDLSPKFGGRLIYGLSFSC